MVENIPPPIPKRLPRKQVDKIRNHLDQRRKAKSTNKSYAQVSSPAADIFKLHDTFPALPNRKIIKIHQASLSKAPLVKRKVQITTKGPSRKQVIIPISSQQADIIMNNAGFHVSSINNQLKGIKSTIQVEFIRPSAQGVIIITNNVLAASDLSIIERYVKFIEGINQKDVLAPRLPQSKSYLKITGLLYIQPSGLALTREDITNYLKNSDLFENIILAAQPRVIKALPKSDMAIIWIDIWDTQSGSKAKILINHSFNYGRFIATIRETNMNPEVSQCHNCWKWGHATFACKAYGSKCQKCGSPYKIKNHRDMAWCCKANFKLDPPQLETKQGEPCPHTFKCLNCKGDHLADDNKCPYWKHRFNHEWHTKKAQEAREIRANSIHLTVGRGRK